MIIQLEKINVIFLAYFKLCSCFGKTIPTSSFPIGVAAITFLFSSHIPVSGTKTSFEVL
jgi:hypothetical protein